MDETTSVEDAMALQIELDQGSDFWTLTLSGELDYSECAAFRMNIDRILKASPPSAIVDLSHLDYLDSSGLGLLLSLSKEYGAQGGRLVLVTNETVDNILSLTRLNGIFTIASSEDQAKEMVADTLR
jgi:anti-sigma B factor antagonist